MPICDDIEEDGLWEDCPYCGGEGFIDNAALMEEDPLWYGNDSIETCHQCKGQHGFWIDLNKNQKEK